MNKYVLTEDRYRNIRDETCIHHAHIPNCAKVPLQLPITISNTLLNHCSLPKDLLNARLITEISKLVSTETKQIIDGLRNAAFGQGGINTTAIVDFTTSRTRIILAEVKRVVEEHSGNVSSSVKEAYIKCIEESQLVEQIQSGIEETLDCLIR